jgi:hypothetical protein
MTFAIHCGMPDEKTRLQRVFPGTVPIFSGVDKFRLPELVSASCRLIVNMGVCGGLAPPLKVADVAAANSIVDKAGAVIDLRSKPLADCVAAAALKGIKISSVPWYSSGLLDEADTKTQRAAIYNKYPPHPMAIDDESRFTVAFAQARTIPCLIIRPLSDDWTETLPLECRGAIMNSDGSANVEYLLQTFQLVDTGRLLQIAADYNKSLDALEAVAKAIAPVLMAA